MAGIIESQNDQKIRLIASGLNNFIVESYYPESEFSLQTSAEYSKFLDKIKGIAEAVGGELVGKAVGQFESAAQAVNALRSTYVGKRYWNPAYDTATFDQNEPLNFTIPFIFSAENASSIEDNIKGTTYSEKNLNRIRKLISLTAPTKSENMSLILPGPYIGSNEKDIGKDQNVMEQLVKKVGTFAKNAATANRAYHTSVSFQIGNWLRIENVIVTSVDAKIHPWLDRFQHFPFYMECDVTIRTAYPPTTQDINKWFLTQTNRT